MDKQKIIHGTAIEVFGYGIVITGSSGSGKSELALKLIDRKHKFIADDQILIEEDQNNKLWLDLPATQFIHLGGIGFIDIAATYGNQAVASAPTKCNLFIQLENTQLDGYDRIVELATHINILNQKVPLAKLYTAQNRPLELLVETLVKKQQQLDNGYNANQTFINNLSNSSKGSHYQA